MATRFLERVIARVRAWPAQALPVLVALAGLAATIFVAAALDQGRQARAQLRFNALVDQANAAVERRLETYVEMLRAGSGLFAASRSRSSSAPGASPSACSTTGVNRTGIP